MKPASREGLKPMPANATIRNSIKSICHNCAYCSDLCKGFINKRKMTDDGYRIITECSGYAKVDDLESNLDE